MLAAKHGHSMSLGVVVAPLRLNSSPPVMSSELSIQILTRKGSGEMAGWFPCTPRIRIPARGIRPLETVHIKHQRVMHGSMSSFIKYSSLIVRSL